MKLAAIVASAALLLGSAVVASPVSAATTDGTTDAGDVQALPRHLQEVPYANKLLGASADYVMHNVHDLPYYDGHSHFTILRTSDGSAAWSDFDASPDAVKESLVGRYYVEQLGEATYWPSAVRFFDVETHQVAGEITVPSGETLFATGPGWLLTTRDTGAASVTSSDVLLHRLDGSTVELSNVAVDSIPTYATDGTDVWLHDNYGGPLWHVDIAAGTASVVPQPAGVAWKGLVIGPTRIFNIEDQYDGHLTVTAIDRDTGVVSSYDLADSFGGNASFLALGDGLAVYEPSDITGTLWRVDLAAGTLGTQVGYDLSDARSMGGGKVATVFEAKAPGAIQVVDGTTTDFVAYLPRVSEAAWALSYDGVVSATWGDDSTWTIDPRSSDPQWTRTDWTDHQRVSTSGETTLVEDIDAQGFPTTHWHLSWPGGSRDVEAGSVVLGHGGELAVVEPPDSTNYEVQRVPTGKVVATADATGAVADGSWVWTWQSPGVLSGVDVDHPDSPAKVVPTGLTSVGLADVRGRWALLVHGGFTVIDTRGVVSPYNFPMADNLHAGPSLGNGFVVWSAWTYDQWHHVSGTSTTVTDLAPGHESRALVDPDYGTNPTNYTADEAGSPSLAYLDRAQQPKVLHLPWLHEAPLTLPDTAPPVLGTVDAPPALVRSSSPVTASFSWSFSDPGTSASPASGIASFDVRTAPGESGPWTSTTSTTAAAVSRVLQPGQQICAQARAVDGAGNASAWSDERCTRVDGAAPVLERAGGSPRFAFPEDGYWVTYSYGAADDDRVSSYDVQSRSAAPRHSLGTWGFQARGTTATFLRQQVQEGSEWCFRFRARDVAGNVSSWSPARCSSVAIQDRAFRSSGNTVPKYTARASDGRYLQLHARGAWLKVRGQVGRTVALWVMVGPRQGKADVLVRGVRVGRLSLGAAHWHRRLVTFPMHRSGTVKVVQRGGRPVGVDAVAVER